MKTEIKVNKQRLDIFLIVVLAYAYIKVYWAIASAVSNQLSSTAFSMVAIAVLVLSVVPAVYGLKQAVLKFLTE